MRITYVGIFPAVDIADTDIHAERGVPVDVDDSLARALLEQPDNWAKAPTRKPKAADAADHQETTR